MKFVSVFCAFLVCLAIVSANQDYRPQNPEVKLTTKVIGTWTDGNRGNRQYTQYDIIVTNLSSRFLKNFVIGTDHTFRVRDGNAYWNVVRINNGDLILPSYQPGIASGASYTFGFILEGTPSQPANLVVKSLIYQ